MISNWQFRGIANGELISQDTGLPEGFLATHEPLQQTDRQARKHIGQRRRE